MKSHTKHSNLLKSKAYHYVLQNFKAWLKTLGYSKSIVYNLPIMIKEYLLYQEQNHKTQLEDITTHSIRNYYYDHLQVRKNKYNNLKSLSNAQLNKHLQALNRFCDYLRKTGKQIIPSLEIRNELYDTKEKDILSISDIKHLFMLTEKHKQDTKNRILELRDKAMLSLFYNCGLRRNEVHHLNIHDVNFNKGYIHVRYGKNNKERFVPFITESKIHFQKYLYDARPKLSKTGEQAFLLSERKKRMEAQSMLVRLKILQNRSNNGDFKSKDLHPHLLRHSIATHLLDKGMDIEDISRFLGHSSLDSTERYTHILNQNNNK
ncbi:MAG: tyrosine-type recombinase/integrase [Flavobacteriales bacterium]